MDQTGPGEDTWGTHERSQRGPGGLSTPPPLPDYLASAPPPPPDRRPLIWAGAAAGVLAVIAALVLLTRSPSTGSTVAAPPAVATVALTQPVTSSIQVTVPASAPPVTMPSPTALTVTATSTAPAASSAVGQHTYVDPRFGFMLTYPADLIGQESDNGDGMTVSSRDTRLQAWGGNTIDETPTLESVTRRWEARGMTVTYRSGGPKAFSVSGIVGGDIVYTRYVVGPGSYAALQWSYPVAKKAELDAAVTESVRSFVPGDLSQSH